MEKRRNPLRLAALAGLVLALPGWACTPALEGTRVESARHVLAYKASDLSVSRHFTLEVAACSKAGGMVAQFFAILALVPPLDIVSVLVFVPTAVALALVVWFGKETRGRDLRDLDPGGHTFAATGV